MAGLFRELVVKDPRLPFREKGQKGKLLPKRADEWPAFRISELEKRPYCINCGKQIKHLVRFRLQLHHVEPFHLFPEKELDPNNVEPMCGNPRCHLDKGHLGDFKKWNPYVRELCALMRQLYKMAPRTRSYKKEEFVVLVRKIVTWSKEFCKGEVHAS